MRYVSTRDASLKISAAEAIARGLSPDGGLFVPENLPKVSAEMLRSLGRMGMHSGRPRSWACFWKTIRRRN